MTLQRDEVSASIARLPAPKMVAGLPVLGSALELAGDILAFVVKNYRQHGPIFRIKALNREYTVMAGPEANLFFSQHGHKHFRSDDFWGPQNAEYGATRSMISMDGPEHVAFRKVQGRSYSRTHVNDYYPELVAIARDEALRWTTPMAGVQAMQRIITEQIGVVTTGFSPREYLDDLVFFLRTVLMVRVTRQRPALLLRNPAYRRAKARIFEFGQEVLAAHRANPNAKGSPDLIDDILALAATDPEFLPESDLLIAVLGPFIAGIDTAANTTAFTLYALLKDPALMARATAEADALFADGIPTPDQLRKLDVLHRVVLETLRRYPIAPAMQRRVEKSFAFGGYRVEADTNVLISTTLPHFLAEHYPDPLRFDIDRYLPERKEHRQPGVYAPFGLGAHVCLGAGLAEVQMILTVATVLHTVRLAMDPVNYELKIDPSPTQKPYTHFRFLAAERRHFAVAVLNGQPKNCSAAPLSRWLPAPRTRAGRTGRRRWSPAAGRGPARCAAPWCSARRCGRSAPGFAAGRRRAAEFDRPAPSRPRDPARPRPSGGPPPGRQPAGPARPDGRRR
jgi:cytochrome P450